MVYLKTRGDYILVGDLMQSMTLLLFNNTTGAIEQVSRDTMVSMDGVHWYQWTGYIGINGRGTLVSMDSVGLCGG